EYRILLRQDNADERLTPRSHKIGLASDERLKQMENKQEKANRLVHYFEINSIQPEEINPKIIKNNGTPVSQSMKMVTILSRPEIGLNDFLSLSRVSGFLKENDLGEDEIEKAEIQIKYRGYIKKEEENADKLKRL